MGTRYITTSVTGYNSSPPADDGSAVGSNQVKWNTVKTKVGDPLNTFAGSIDTKLVTALDMSMSTTAVNYTTTTADHLKPVRVTAAATIHLGDAATMAVGYQTAVVNAFSAAITVDLATAGNKLNTIVGGSISLQPGNAIIVAVNQTGDGYDILGHSFFDDTTPAPKIAGATVNYNAEVSLASASTVNIGAAVSNNILITGTTTITAFDNVAAGITRKVRFNGALTLTHNGTSLILPGSANIVTAANDCAEFMSFGSGNWICRSYTKSLVDPYGPYAVYTISNQATLDIPLPVGFTIARLDLLSVVPVTTNVSLFLRVSTDNGSTYYSGVADYAYAQFAKSSTGIDISANSDATSQLFLIGTSNLNNNSAMGLSGNIEIFNYTGTIVRKFIQFKTSYEDNGGTNVHHVTGSGDCYNATAVTNALTNIRLQTSSGNLSTGTVKLWVR